MSEHHAVTRLMAWAAVGAVSGGLAAVFGVLGLAVLLAVIVVAGTRAGAATSAGGVLLGIGVPLLWFGYAAGAVDRTCRSGSIDVNGVETCTAWASTGAIRWPWFAAAALVIGVGLWLHLGARRREATSWQAASAASA